MEWNFNREKSNGFEVIPEGDYRVRIDEAEKAVSKNGNDMLSLRLDVSGHNSRLFHHITFLPDRPEITNRNLTQFFDSFKDISDGDLNEQNWIGKVGACHVKHEEYNGNIQAKVGYFISADKQDSLPPWQEPDRNSDEPVDIPATDGEFKSAMGEKLPF